MLIYSHYKYLNCLMLYPYILKQYVFVNEMYSIGNENCEHIIKITNRYFNTKICFYVLAYLIVQQVDPTSKQVH